MKTNKILPICFLIPLSITPITSCSKESTIDLNIFSTGTYDSLESSQISLLAKTTYNFKINLSNFTSQQPLQSTNSFGFCKQDKTPIYSTMHVNKITIDSLELSKVESSEDLKINTYFIFHDLSFDAIEFKCNLYKTSNIFISLACKDKLENIKAIYYNYHI